MDPVSLKPLSTPVPPPAVPAGPPGAPGPTEPAPTMAGDRSAIAPPPAIAALEVGPIDLGAIDLGALNVPAIDVDEHKSHAVDGKSPGLLDRLKPREQGQARVRTVPDAVRAAYPDLIRALDGVLLVEDYDVPVVQRHVADLARMPENVLDRMRHAGLREVHIANRFMPDLDSNASYKDQSPRGWPPGKTWNEVPGTYNRKSKSVVAGCGEAGTHSVILHEFAHGMGELLKYQKSRELDAAHKRLYDKLPAYLQQGGPGGTAGKEELFAEGVTTYLMDGPAAAAERFDPAFATYIGQVVLKLPPVDPAILAGAREEAHPAPATEAPPQPVTPTPATPTPAPTEAAPVEAAPTAGPAPELADHARAGAPFYVPQRVESEDGWAIGTAYKPVMPGSPELDGWRPWLRMGPY